jgi:adenosine/AMP kinase
MAEIMVISVARCVGDIFDVYVTMQTPVDVIVHRFQQSRKIVLSLRLASPR